MAQLVSSASRTPAHHRPRDGGVRWLLRNVPRTQGARSGGDRGREPSASWFRGAGRRRAPTQSAISVRGRAGRFPRGPPPPRSTASRARAAWTTSGARDRSKCSETIQAVEVSCGDHTLTNVPKGPPRALGGTPEPPRGLTAYTAGTPRALRNTAAAAPPALAPLLFVPATRKVPGTRPSHAPYPFRIGAVCTPYLAHPRSLIVAVGSNYYWCVLLRIARRLRRAACGHGRTLLKRDDAIGALKL
jgi:hypothetical protein